MGFGAFGAIRRVGSNIMSLDRETGWIRVFGLTLFNQTQKIFGCIEGGQLERNCLDGKCLIRIVAPLYKRYLILIPPGN
jgi:hypothetical protein